MHVACRSAAQNCVVAPKQASSKGGPTTFSSGKTSNRDPLTSTQHLSHGPWRPVRFHNQPCLSHLAQRCDLPFMLSIQTFPKATLGYRWRAATAVSKIGCSCTDPDAPTSCPTTISASSSYGSRQGRAHSELTKFGSEACAHLHCNTAHVSQFSITFTSSQVALQTNEDIFLTQLAHC